VSREVALWPPAEDPVPALKALAPKQTEPPFVAAQGLLLAPFVVLTVVAAVRFRDKPSSPP